MRYAVFDNVVGGFVQGAHRDVLFFNRLDKSNPHYDEWAKKYFTQSIDSANIYRGMNAVKRSVNINDPRYEIYECSITLKKVEL